MKKFLLMTTSGCHLCKEAEHMLSVSKKHYQINYQLIEISEYNNLIKEFGTKIPALISQETNNKIFWPFNIEELFLWINKN